MNYISEFFHGVPRVSDFDHWEFGGYVLLLRALFQVMVEDDFDDYSGALAVVVGNNKVRPGALDCAFLGGYASAGEGYVDGYWLFASVAWELDGVFGIFGERLEEPLADGGFSDFVEGVVRVALLHPSPVSEVMLFDLPLFRNHFLVAAEAEISGSFFGVADVGDVKERLVSHGV